MAGQPLDRVEIGVAGLVGVLIERFIIRFLYGRPLETLLATFGVSLALQQGVRSIFGPTNREVGAPAFMSGAFDFYGLSITWGRMWIIAFALAVFLVIVFVYIAVRFDREMSIAAMGSLFFDLIVTAGIYSLVGWEVTPATVIGLLTILGFSIYDTVVVFDKVRENVDDARKHKTKTFSQAANMAINQTLVRSINTSIVGLLPVGAILFIGAALLGAGTLKDLALSQFVGIIYGTLATLFVATPLYAALRSREPAVRRIDEAAEASAGRSGASGEDSEVPLDDEDAGSVTAGATTTRAGGSTA